MAWSERALNRVEEEQQEGPAADVAGQPGAEAGTIPQWGLPTQEALEDLQRQLERRRETIERLKDREEFTPSQVALLTNVSTRTVVKWFDAGRLGGELRGRRRVIPREVLVRFLQEHGMPIPWVRDQPE
jgi:excisionase family DNA binding protein